MFGKSVQLVLFMTALIVGSSPTLFAGRSPETNIMEGGVSAFSSDIDYFPDKAVIEDAHFSLEYHNNYKLVTVERPWRNADTGFRYLLVQRGTPAPRDYPDARIIKIPVETVVTMSTTYLAHLDMLGFVDRLVGHDMLYAVSAPSVRRRIDEGKVKEVGTGENVNIEILLDLDPGLIVLYGMGEGTDAHPKLMEAGFPVAINAEYMETSPLARSEWIKFLALFFNAEKRAADAYEGIKQEYLSLSAMARNEPEKPSVFCNNFSWGAWWMPGGRNFMARLLEDAGAEYLWKDDQSYGSLQLDFEVVYDKALNADFWVNVGYQIYGREDLLAQDERYREFRAYREGRLYNNNARETATGGDDFWESGLARPNVILADLIKIFHPELVPDHEFVFYRTVE